MDRATTPRGFVPSNQSQLNSGVTQEQLQGYFNSRRSAAPSFGTASRFTNSQPNRSSNRNKSPPNSRNYRTPGRADHATTTAVRKGGDENQFSGVDPRHIDPYGSFAQANKSANNPGSHAQRSFVPGPGYYTPPTSSISKQSGRSFAKASRQLAASGQPRSVHQTTKGEAQLQLNPVVGPGRYSLETADPLLRPRVQGGAWDRASKHTTSIMQTTRAQTLHGGHGGERRYADALATKGFQEAYHCAPGPGCYDVVAANVCSTNRNDKKGGAMARTGRTALYRRETAAARSVPGPGYYTPLYGA